MLSSRCSIACKAPVSRVRPSMRAVGLDAPRLVVRRVVSPADAITPSRLLDASERAVHRSWRDAERTRPAKPWLIRG